MIINPWLVGGAVALFLAIVQKNTEDKATAEAIEAETLEATKKKKKKKKAPSIVNVSPVAPVVQLEVTPPVVSADPSTNSDEVPTHTQED